MLAEGKKINLAVGAQWQSKRVGSELGRGFEVKPSTGRRSSGDRSDRFWAFLLTVKRDTQKERTTKSVLGFLVNSETRHTEGANNQIYRFLYSVTVVSCEITSWKRLTKV